MFEQISTGKASLLPVIIKADVQGSVEAVNGALLKAILASLPPDFLLVI